MALSLSCVSPNSTAYEVSTDYCYRRCKDACIKLPVINDHKPSGLKQHKFITS